jgi:hypothetical protein
MKIRAGFVSNSSSASFIIRWREIEECDSGSIEEAISNLYDLEYKEDDFVNSITKEKIEDKDLMYPAYRVAKWALENTKKIDDYYQTEGFTWMMNSYADFPSEMSAFFFALSVSHGIEIVTKFIDQS